MTCEETLRRLDDFVDGELAEPVRSLVQEHLGTCLSCRRELLELRALLDQTAELPREISPLNDLWQGITLRIGATRWPRETAGPEGRSSRPWWLYLAAAGVAFVVLSTPISMWWLSRPAAPEEATAVAPVAEPDPGALAMLARSEDGVLQPRIDLETLLERRRPLLEPETAAVLERHIDLMDRAIGEIRAALDDNPQDPRLLRLLASRYQQEAALLQRYSHV